MARSSYYLIICVIILGCQKQLENPASVPKLLSDLAVSKSLKSLNTINVVVRLHPTENYYPIDPLAFISQSRFRHERSGSDEGYNKSRNEFVRTNSKNAEYYDISPQIINTFSLQNGNKNRRPRDENRGDFNVFLEPDNNLTGNSNVNSVSSFYYTINNKIQYWLFYGYNYSNFSGLSFSHQGDWESVTLNIPNGILEGAWLSAHGDDQYYPISNLEIETVGTVQTLYVYSARGTHALYNHPGNYHILGTDEAMAGGVEWNIVNNTLPLIDQPWKDYAGAWGEIGEQAATTGPLGPWYKKIQ